jgi:hypothetical protein
MYELSSPTAPAAPAAANEGQQEAVQDEEEGFGTLLDDE